MTDIYLEVGAKRVFACAVDWPGWCRHGEDEPSALQALLDYGPRYAKVVAPSKLGFEPPAAPQDLRVVERLKGNATTDFGAPGAIAACDRRPAAASDYVLFEAVLRAGWGAFDAARKQAKGKRLSKGPRGGGREPAAIVNHVLEADLGYLNALGWKHRPAASKADPVDAMRQSILEALKASERGEIAAVGPRGGARWPVRFYVRRTAWHVIAHVWEIERRLL